MRRHSNQPRTHAITRTSIRQARLMNCLALGMILGGCVIAAFL